MRSLALFALLAIPVFGITALKYSAAEDVRFVVTDKERVMRAESSRYLVYTEHPDTGEVEVFENTDAWLSGKFRSSDLQARLKIGSVCDARVIGFRMGFLSSYRNIIRATCEEAP